MVLYDNLVYYVYVLYLRQTYGSGEETFDSTEDDLLRARYEEAKRNGLATDSLLETSSDNWSPQNRSSNHTPHKQTISHQSLNDKHLKISQEVEEFDSSELFTDSGPLPVVLSRKSSLRDRVNIASSDTKVTPVLEHSLPDVGSPPVVVIPAETSLGQTYTLPDRGAASPNPSAEEDLHSEDMEWKTAAASDSKLILLIKLSRWVTRILLI